MRTFHYVLRNPKLYDVLLPTVLAAQADALKAQVLDEANGQINRLRSLAWRDVYEPGGAVVRQTKEAVCVSSGTATGT